MMRSRWTRRGVQLLLLLLAFGFLTYNAGTQSPTMDEQNHMARGYALLRTGDPRLSVEHPPLINLLEALPLGRGVALPLDHESWNTGNWYQFADLFLWRANTRPERMVFLSRMPIVALTLLLAALVARWAGELGGPWAALAGQSLVLLDPNVLAHGSLATTDLGITFTALVAAYTLWRAAVRPGWLPSFAAGVAIGAMLASKMSAIVFWGSFGLVFVAGCWYHRRHDARHRTALMEVVRGAGLYGAMTVVGLLVVWATYALQIAPAVEDGIALPMGTYWAGLAAVFRNVQGGHTSYLLGATRLGGWRLYFPITFLAKTPLPQLLLLAVIPFVPTENYRRWRGLFLLVPVGIYWLSTLTSELNLGYRHLLPTLPLLYIWLGYRISRVSRPLWRRYASAMLAWLLVEAVWIAPHFLAYFNPLAGGPEKGWQVVADSNIDWGQDLGHLSTYLKTHANGEKVRLSWFGSSYPEHYGIDYDPLPGLPHHHDLWFQPPTFNEAQPEPGLYAISVSNLVEIPLMDKHFFAYFREREPDQRIGYSIYVYRIEEQ